MLTLFTAYKTGKLNRKQYFSGQEMFFKALKSKIHRARVTGTKIDYPGSIAVDTELLNAVGIKPYEAVLLANVTNGSRAETYVVEAETSSKKVEVLGAAARIFNPGDVIIIINFAFFTQDEIDRLKPKVIALDENNNIIKTL